MKKIFYTLLVVVVLALVFVPVAFAQETNPPPVIEDFPLLYALIVSGIGWLVSAGIKSVAAAFGIDLQGKAMAITGALVIASVNFINGFLASVPANYYPVVVSGLGFLVSVLGAFGIAGTLRRFQN